MAGLLLLLFVIVPIVELYVLIEVGGSLGAGPTIALLVLFTVAGVWMVKRQGLGVWTRFRREAERGDLPANEIIDGFLLLVAGALLIVPGFVTDLFGVLLLVPPIRAVVRNLIARRYRGRLQMASVGYGGPGVSFRSTRIYDVEDVGDVTPAEWREGGRPRGELGP